MASHAVAFAAADAAIQWLGRGRERIAQKPRPPPRRLPTVGGWDNIWIADDLEAARMDANFNSRPWGASGHSPIQCWESRAPITAAQRIEFIHTVKSASEEARVDMGLPRTGSLDRAAQASVGRAAVRRALQTLGLLFVTRRRFSPTFKT